MKNELPSGARRVGSLIDFDEATPLAVGVLERSDERIILTVTWHDFESPYAAWFGHGRNRTKTAGGRLATRVPRVLLFQDANGPVLLVGCRNAGYHTNVFGPGSGTIAVDYAVLGVADNCDFSRATGAESEVSGLREWLGISSVDLTVDEGQGTSRDVIVVEASPAIFVGGPFNLEFRPASEVVGPRSSGEWRVRDLVYCLTTEAATIDVEELLGHHRAVRDLLVVARWWPESCILRRATHPGAPLRSIDGQEHGAQWSDIVVSPDRPPERPRGYWDDLIRFDEIGTDGILRWIQLREDFARALDPVIATRYLDVNFPATYLAQVGPGLEALGYLLLLRDGMSKRKANDVVLEARLERVLADVGDCAPVNVGTWATTTAAAYNGVKHVNRQLPDPVDALNTWRESVLVVRAWVAIELGVAAKEVKERLRRDPQARPWAPV